MRLPKGMDLILHLRKQGAKPEWPVTVYLDQDRPRWPIYSDMPILCDVCILPRDDLGALDFRPLRGLVVEVVSMSISDRLKKLLKALRRVEPKGILGGVPSEKLLFSWTPDFGWEVDHGVVA